MDNKINKERFKTFFYYDSIKTFVIGIITIVVLVLIFNVVSKRPTNGQDFYLMNAEGVTLTGEGTSLLSGTKNGDYRFKFSYDVLEASTMSPQSAGLYSAQYMMTVYLSANQCDVFLSVDNRSEDEDSSMFQSFVDGFSAVKIEEYIENAKTYSLQYVDVNGDNVVAKDAEVERLFEIRNGKDSRFEKAGTYEEGLKGEKERVVAIYKNAVILEKVLNNHPELLYFYTSAEYPDSLNGNYGINLSKLNGKNGKVIENDFICSLNTEEKSYDILLSIRSTPAIDKDLCYENLAFINNIIDIYSTYIDEVLSWEVFF